MWFLSAADAAADKQQKQPGAMDMQKKAVSGEAAIDSVMGVCVCVCVSVFLCCKVTTDGGAGGRITTTMHTATANTATTTTLQYVLYYVLYILYYIYYTIYMYIYRYYNTNILLYSIYY